MGWPSDCHGEWCVSAVVIVFWSSLALLAYIYAGYPLLVWALGRVRPFTPRREPFTGRLSIVIAGYNEANRLGAKLDSLFASDCASQIEEVLIGSDGSDDNTSAVIAGFGDARVRLVPFTVRRGKPAVLNDVIPQCRNELVILMDARQALDPLALSRLAACMADGLVGVVSGELVFRSSNSGSTAAEGIGAYWKYEKFIRKSESRFRSVPGATGALYAIRKSLFRPIPPQTLLDDVVIPMQAVEQGYRCLIEPGAIAYDTPSQSPQQESVRKRRTIAGAAQLIINQPRWLLPWKNPIWLEFISHKIARLWSPALLVIAAATNLVLAAQTLYGILLGLQVLFYIAAGVGYVFQRQGKKSSLFGLPLMFVSLNTTTTGALWDALRGRFRATWQRAA
jgi:biofilm PGA synthesis N-glycosyltransferase PgaC